MKQVSAEKLHKFAKDELKNMVDQPRSTMIWDISETGLKVGHLKISLEGEKWSVLVDSVQKKMFNKKINAVTFAILWQRENYNLAQDLLENDSSQGYLQQELDYLQLLMKKSLRSRDIERFGLYHNKYSNTLAKKRSVSSQIEKTLNSTKYIKLG